MVSDGGLTKLRPIGVGHSKREIANFAGMGLTKELIKGISTGSIKFGGLIPFIKLHRYLTKGFEGGAPVRGKSRPIPPNWRLEPMIT